MTLLTRMIAAFLTVAVAVGMMIALPHGLVPTAEAVPSPAPSSEVSPEQYRALFNDLERSDVSRVEDLSSGYRTVTFTIDQWTLTLTDPNQASPSVTGGTNQFGIWIGFNRAEQNALVGGGAAALAVAICAIPVVGWVACAAASAIVMGAAGYIMTNGICSNNRILYWFDVRGGSTFACLYVPPDCDFALPAGGMLKAGDHLCVGWDSQLTADMQGDGNFVVYDRTVPRAIWWSGTASPSAFVTLQQDGNLVVYSKTGMPLWNSGTNRCGSGSTLRLQTDANLAIYTASGRASWSSLTGRTGIC